MSCPAVIEVITPGPPGPVGPTGPAGVGSAWLQGAGVPGGGTGAEGDFYLDTETGDIYGPLTDGDWGLVVFNIAEGQAGPQGPTGEVGPAGPAGVDGRAVLNGTSAPSNSVGNNGDFFINTAASIIYGPKAADVWPAGVSLIGPAGAIGPSGPSGANGKEVQLQTSATHVQWRYVGDSTWINLVPLSEITGPQGAVGTQGPAGQNIELQTSATHIQWRVVGAPTWTNLVLLSSLTGPAGPAGPTGANGSSAYQVAVAAGFVGTEAQWLASLVGPQGPQGATGPQGPAGSNATATPLSDATPQAPGTAAAGTASSASRSDHVHPLPPLVSASAAGLVPAFTSATGKVFTDGGWATPTAGTPGGSNGQLQFNNNGAFGGVSTLTTDGSGNLTFSGQWINSRNGAASAPASALTGTWFTGGTATTTKPQFLIEPAGTTSTNWSASGTGLGVNAASGFAGNLLDLQVNGSQVFTVGSTADLARFVTIGYSSWAHGFGCNSQQLVIISKTNNALNINGNEVRMASTGTFGFCGSTTNQAIIDTLITRDAAGTLAQRNGTNAQTFRVYNTFTSSTNYELGKLEWSSNVFRVGTEKGSGGGTARALELQTDGTTRLTFAANGSAITAASGTALVGNHRLTGAAPASATDAGTAGDIRYDGSFVYLCAATNTWVRAALSTW